MPVNEVDKLEHDGRGADVERDPVESPARARRRDRLLAPADDPIALAHHRVERARAGIGLGLDDLKPAPHDGEADVGRGVGERRLAGEPEGRPQEALRLSRR